MPQNIIYPSLQSLHDKIIAEVTEDPMRMVGITHMQGDGSHISNNPRSSLPDGQHQLQPGYPVQQGGDLGVVGSLQGGH